MRKVAVEKPRVGAMDAATSKREKNIVIKRSWVGSTI